jgi:DNA-binding ferritin-like protein
MDVRETRTAPLHTRTDLKPNAVRDISGALNILLADMFALYLKTKNFHWHMSGPHFRDYHLLLDEQGDQIFATTDAIAERVRKSVARPCVRSATSAACNAFWTTMRTLSHRCTCLPNCAMTI